MGNNRVTLVSCTSIFSPVIYQCTCAETRYGVLMNTMNTMNTINFRIELEQEDIQKVKEKTYPANRGRSKFGLKGIRIVYAKAKNDQSQDTLTTLKAQHLVVAHEEMLNDKRREIAQRGLDNLARALTITEEEFDQRYQLT